MTSRLLIFRTAELTAEPAMPAGISFRLVETLAGALRVAPAYLAIYGPAATAKMIAKLAVPGRSYYAAFAPPARIVSDGWIRKGRCSFYPVGPRDCVIGPIQTVEQWRGRGVAHAILVRAANGCIRRGAPWVYIDTTEDNLASQRTIAKGGFRPNAQTP